MQAETLGLGWHEQVAVVFGDMLRQQYSEARHVGMSEDVVEGMLLRDSHKL